VAKTKIILPASNIKVSVHKVELQVVTKFGSGKPTQTDAEMQFKNCIYV
jgi:hypothetical protein